MKTVIVPEGRLDSVPLELIDSWEDLQTFSADLLKLKYPVIDVRDYLRQGAEQDGIDVYATTAESDYLISIQCKLVKKMSPGELEAIFDLFLSKEFAPKTKLFIICTTFDLRKRNHEKKLQEARQKLRHKGIALKVWDVQGINQELRTSPTHALIDLTVRYFTGEVAERFYGSFYADFLKKWRSVPKHQYLHHGDYIPRRLIRHEDYYQRPDYHYSWHSDDRSRQPLYDIIHAADKKNGNRVLVLSIGGFGKSVELQQLAAVSAGQKERHFPILHLLKDYSGQSIEYILSLHGIKWDEIDEESLLIILDGYDEIKSVYLAEFIMQLNLFADARPKVNIVVSSRFNFYDPDSNGLRGFEIYVLEQFSQADIDLYLDLKIRGREAHFNNRLSESRLIEYTHNPYYLVRLVRIFESTEANFPTSKSEFFKQILFERLEEEQKRYGIRENQADLLHLAKKVAYCMTMCGESAIKEAGLLKIVPDGIEREKLQRYFLMNKNADEQKRWSFEHKNLQEYLSALCLQEMSFEKVIEAVTFSATFEKVQPRFVNTLSFLFSLPERGNAELLFSWLLDREPDMLMRFEKSRLSKTQRSLILQSVIKHYKGKGLFFYSAVIEIYEVAAFIDIDGDDIDFLEKELFDSSTSDRLAYDLISLLEKTRSPWVHKEQLIGIFLRVISENTRSPRVQGDAISALINLEFREESVFRAIYATADLNQFELRNAMVKFLADRPFAGRYMNFLIDSVPIFIAGQQESSLGLASENLIRTMRKAMTESNVVQLLQFISSHKEHLKYHHHPRRFGIDDKEFGKILQQASPFYPNIPAILKPVYKLFRTLDHVTMDRNWFPAFKLFFQSTCGGRVLFDKLYKYSRRSRDAAYFADKQSCEWLIGQYSAGALEDREMMLWRNWMPRDDDGIHNWFYERLKEEYGDRFIYSDEGIDYKAIREEYAVKNQEMILDRNLFLREVKKIFELVGKEKLNASDFDSFSNAPLCAHSDSLAYKKVISGMRGRRKKTYQDFERDFDSAHKWEWFQMRHIESLLKNKDGIVNETLLEFARVWCKEKIETLDFSNAVTVTTEGIIRINNAVYFVQGLFCLLEIELLDDLLLKMLPSDIHVYDEKNLSTIVASKVVDRSLLRRTLISNIRSGGLSFPALENHFGLCANLGYRECLRDLYTVLTEFEGLTYHSLKSLTDYYLQLGGRIQDFQRLIKTPEPSADPLKTYIDWNWHLIAKMAEAEPEFIRKIMVTVIDDPMQTEQNKNEACTILYKTGDIKGLVYWKNYVLSHKSLLFDRHFSHAIAQSALIPGNDAIFELIDMLKTVYQTGLHLILKRFDSVEEVIYSSLNAIALSGTERFSYVIDSLNSVLEEPWPSSVHEMVAYKLEGIKQNFFTRNEQSLTIENAIASFEALQRA